MRLLALQPNQLSQSLDCVGSGGGSSATIDDPWLRAVCWADGELATNAWRTGLGLPSKGLVFALCGVDAREASGVAAREAAREGEGEREAAMDMDSFEVMSVITE